MNKLKVVLEAICQANKTPRNILDVGCASGWFLNEVSKRFPKANCILPFNSNYFDVVICAEVLEHVENPDLERFTHTTF